MAAALASLAACSSSDEAGPATGSGAGGGDPTAGAGGISDITSVEYFNVVVGDRVFFDTDRHDLDAPAQATLVRQAAWLAQNPGATAVIEGHADERGTREYNLGLGARRANAVRSFLISQGVAPGRLSSVSYGKERPVALCSDESCWSQNRRSVSVVTKAAGS
ncbi:hypothetical protein LNKW23_25540 [Paralimibaculum aggregatum]|uniref:Peptidoglycan-associated protein n=1 Tax=Paralimibaculum aggregatum TaxID=3036245 RepID=A0ABQ6LJ87_9RHOB|nr:peptidoglycan-associated lipoprotein Pal [Limibaculum sp. NKW23]GMG83341.1 hypothetical protein LNKW23_25540 [Limibaculum sp. NKW23]